MAPQTPSLVLDEKNLKVGQVEVDISVSDPFKGMNLPELRSVIKAMTDKVRSTFESVRGEDGKADYARLTDEQGKELGRLNTLLAEATPQLERLTGLQTMDGETTKIASFLDLPQETVRRVLAGDLKGAAKAYEMDTGKAFLESEAYKAAKEEGAMVGALKRAGEIELPDPIWGLIEKYGGVFLGKAVLGTDSALAGVGSEYPPESTRIGTIVETLYQAHNIAPLIPQIGTTQNAVVYMTETVNAQGAAETEEGALGAEASIDWAEATEPIRKIVVLLPITEEMLADEPLIRGIANGRLRQFMGNREDLQILKGDGTAPNLSGILDRAGLGNVNWSVGTGTAQQMIEAIFQAGGTVMEAFQTPTDVVMAWDTWEYARLAKDSQNNYLLGPAGIAGVQRLWGWPVTTNQNMDTRALATNIPVLVGDFRGAATIFRRESLMVEVSDSHDDRFARGVLTMRMKERLALAVWRAAGFATVTVVA